MQAQQELYTFNQVAAIYHCNTRTVRNWYKLHCEAINKKSYGRMVQSTRKFTEDEVEVLASYGTKVAHTETVIEPEVVEPGQLIQATEVDEQSSALFNFNIGTLQINLRNTDTGKLENQTDQLKQVTQRAFTALSNIMTNDLAAEVKQAMVQNRHAVAGMQAQASTEVVKHLNVGQ